jgi:hypothetical protein
MVCGENIEHPTSSIECSNWQFRIVPGSPGAWRAFSRSMLDVRCSVFDVPLLPHEFPSHRHLRLRRRRPHGAARHSRAAAAGKPCLSRRHGARALRQQIAGHHFALCAGGYPLPSEQRPCANSSLPCQFSASSARARAPPSRRPAIAASASLRPQRRLAAEPTKRASGRRSRRRETTPRYTS